MKNNCSLHIALIARLEQACGWIISRYSFWDILYIKWISFITRFCSIFQQLLKVPNTITKLWNDKLHKYMRYFFNFPKELTVEEKMLFLNQSLKITFVRHPFVRLVSTFQDKVIDTNYQNWRFALLKKPSYEEVNNN